MSCRASESRLSAKRSSIGTSCWIRYRSTTAGSLCHTHGVQKGSGVCTVQPVADEVFLPLLSSSLITRVHEFLEQQSFQPSRVLLLSITASTCSLLLDLLLLRGRLGSQATHRGLKRRRLLVEKENESPAAKRILSPLFLSTSLATPSQSRNICVLLCCSTLHSVSLSPVRLVVRLLGGSRMCLPDVERWQDPLCDVRNRLETCPEIRIRCGEDLPTVWSLRISNP